MTGATSAHFGGGLEGYRAFLLRTEGSADPVRRSLARREAGFAELESRRPRARWRPDRDTYLRNLKRRHPEPGLEPRMLWLLATAKMNQGERFGVGLGEVYGVAEEVFESQPERLYVTLQEHYHTRILADVLRMFDLPFRTVPPPAPMRLMIKLFVRLPHERVLPFVGAAEIVGCVLFHMMRERGVALFADEPPVAARIRSLYDEILADEIGHVGFIAAKLPRWVRSCTRFLARHVMARSVLRSIPELELVLGREALRARLRVRFDVEAEARAFDGRAYGAAAM